MDKVEDKKYCINEVLRINPTNENAKKALSNLDTPSEPTFEEIIPPIAPTTNQSAAQVSAPNKKPGNKSSTRNIIILIILIMIACCIATILAVNDNSNGLKFGENKIEYVISGTAKSASITYYNAQAGTEQVNTSIPWKKSFNMKNGSPVSLLAQNGNTGSLTCEIWLNGKVWKTSTSTAQYGIVTCAGWIGLD